MKGVDVGKPLAFEEVLALLTEDELLGEYDWHRHRGKMHRRAGRYGLYWWHQLQAGQICDALGRLYEATSPDPVQLALEVPGRVEPDARLDHAERVLQRWLDDAPKNDRLRTD